MEISVLGRRLAEARKARNISQIRLAMAADVAPNTIARLEQGYAQSIRSDSLLKLADTLGVSTDYLLGRTDRMELEENEIEPALAS